MSDKIQFDTNHNDTHAPYKMDEVPTTFRPPVSGHYVVGGMYAKLVMGESYTLAQVEGIAELTKERNVWEEFATKLEAKLSASEARAAVLRGALFDLCYLKEQKDKYGDNPTYQRQKPVAWEKANKALTAYDIATEGL